MSRGEALARCVFSKPLLDAFGVCKADAELWLELRRHERLFNFDLRNLLEARLRP